MTEPAASQPDQSTESALSITNVNGGVTMTDAQVDVGGDVVGRDKVTSTTVVVQPGATLVMSGPPAAIKADLVPTASKRQYYEPEMVLIAAGPFLMGSKRSPGVEEAETDQHEVTLPAYYIGKYPITNQEYAEFLSHEIRQDPPKGWPGRTPPDDKLDHPVVNVRWTDAVAYCQWLSKQTGHSYRLPTEAEWEKAARGSDGRVYPWGDSWADNACNAGGKGTMPVNAHFDGASPFGCQDMLGNVEEWTSTLWGSASNKDFRYPYRPDDGREVMEAHHYFVRRVHRGGSYRNTPRQLRCSARNKWDPDGAVEWRGFRVAYDS